MLANSLCFEDFLDEDQIKEIYRLQNARWIQELVIEPDIERINQYFGYPQDTFFLANLCEYTVRYREQKEAERRRGGTLH